MRNVKKKASSALGVAATVVALGLVSPSAASAAPVMAAGFDGAPCGHGFVYGAQVWHNCEMTSVLVGMTAYDGPTERIFNPTQCVQAGDTQILIPTYAVMHSYAAGYGC